MGYSENSNLKMILIRAQYFIGKPNRQFPRRSKIMYSTTFNNNVDDNSNAPQHIYKNTRYITILIKVNERIIEITIQIPSHYFDCIIM